MSNESTVEYEKLIYENEPKAYQLKLVYNTYRDVPYVHIRKYFLSFEGEYIPSKEGISMEATLSNVTALVDGLMELCSKAEAREIIDKYYEKHKDVSG